MTTSTEPHRARHAAPARPLAKVASFFAARRELAETKRTLAAERLKSHALTQRAADVDPIERDRDRLAIELERAKTEVRERDTQLRRALADNTALRAQRLDRDTTHPDDQATHPIDVRTLRAAIPTDCLDRQRTVRPLRQAPFAQPTALPGEETTLTIPVP